jgi:two-component system, OmpR family, sensor histidine kinase SenX3
VLWECARFRRFGWYSKRNLRVGLRVRVSNQFSRDRFFLPAVLGIFVLALLWLGVLLYRWSTQVSEVSRMRVGVDLHAMMTNWQLEFYRQISEIAIALQVGPDSGARDNWKDYLERYRRWSKDVSDPGLVKDVLIWETSRPDRARLLHFDLKQGTVVTVSTPEILSKLLSQLQQSSKNLPTALRAWDLSSTRAANSPGVPANSFDDGMTTGWQFVPDVPAVVHPIVHQSLPGDVARDHGAAPDWIIVVYDWVKISSELIPTVTQEYFGNPEGLQFKVAVVKAFDRQPVATIYSSDPDFGIEAPTDATMDIFGPAPKTVESRAWQAVHGPRALEPDWHSLSGLIWFPVIQSSQRNETWQLQVGHRQGSLGNIFLWTRRRNLILGLSVLGVLSLVAIVVLTASYRAHTLSKLQMQFVASVSHELRTPLAVLSSASENLADGVVRDPDRLAQYRAMMAKQIRHLSHLVDQVLLFASRSETAPQASLSAVDVSVVLNDVLHDLNSMLEQHEIVVQTSLQPELPRVWGDPMVLYQSLQNLITNAIKYSGQDHWIGIGAAVVQEPRHGESVRISVEDHGVGIPKSDVPHIFKPFYRSPTVTASNIHGTGLGLSITRSLVEAIVGSVSVKSEVGKGTRFALHLRIAGRNGNIRSGNTGASA